jgi:predicted phage terminase large subunit-like protein
MSGQRGNEAAELRRWLRDASPRWDWDAAHLRLIQAELARVTVGLGDRLMLFLPPRHGKSELVTVRYPVLGIERRRDFRVIVGAYNQALAERFSRKARRIAAGRFALANDRNSAAEWETPDGGGVRAVGVGGGVTGLGADLILIDDPVKSREEAESRTYRDRVWDWYRDDLYTRQEPGCALILVMTRWHEDDLAGRILASEEGPRWRVVRLPALAESEAEYAAWAERQLSMVNSDPLRRAEGEPLWPDRFNQQALHRIKTALGARSFAALYQGRPLPAEGGLFKREWFKLVDVLPEPPEALLTPGPHSAAPSPGPGGLPSSPASPPGALPELPPDASHLERMRHARAAARGDFDPLPLLIPARERADYEHRRRMEEIAASQSALRSPRSPIRWVRFWDTAAKAGPRSDYWAGALLVRLPEGEWYLVDVVRGRWEYPEAKRRVLEVAARDGDEVPVLIEESANGTALLQDLKADPRADGYWIGAERVAAEKSVRAGAWASVAESGRFYLVRGGWNAAFLAEAEAFPHGAHDDQVDAVSGAFGYLFRQSLRPRVTAFAGRAR